MENCILTNMCMVSDGGGNVLVQARIDPSWPGITFPGGHVEAGEPFVDAAVREVYEETGLRVSNLKLCGIQDWQRDDGARYVVFFYKTETFSGELTSSHEGEVFRTPVDGLEKMKLASGMESMLRVFLDDSLNEMFYIRENGEWKVILK